MGFWPVFLIVALLSSCAMAVELWFAARRDAQVRPWAVVTTLAAIAVPAAIVLHNVLSAIIRGDEGVTFVLALLVAPAAFMAGVIGAGIAITRRDRRLGAAVLLCGAGMGLFAAYSLFALVVTSIEGGNPSYQAPIEAIVLPAAAIALLLGVLGTAGALAAPSRRLAA